METNTITIGSTTYVRLTAGNLNVIDSRGCQLIWYNTEGNICYIVNGAVETSSMNITDV